MSTSIVGAHFVKAKKGLLKGYELSDQLDSVSDSAEGPNRNKLLKPKQVRKTQGTARSDRQKKQLPQTNPDRNVTFSEDTQKVMSPVRQSPSNSDADSNSNHHSPSFVPNPYNAHRTKRPTKSALKKSKVRSLPSVDTSFASSTPQPSANISTPTKERSGNFSSTTGSISIIPTTPPPTSSSFTRRQYNKQRRYDAQNNASHAVVVHDDDSWRKDGREIRKRLIEEDNATCGNELIINKHRNLAKYCGIADRVSACCVEKNPLWKIHWFWVGVFDSMNYPSHQKFMIQSSACHVCLHCTQVQDQFQVMYDSGDKLEEAYIMGNRLIKFLSEVIPTHDHFYVVSKQSPELAKLRIRTQNNLLTVRKQMEDIAFAFDKEIYKVEMEKQGLEFDQSPQRLISERKSRKKIVTFAVQDDEHHDCEFRYAQQQQQQQQQQSFNSAEDNEYSFRPATPKSSSKLNCQPRINDLSSPISSISNSDFDLSLWEDRDPGMEIVDMSFSSETDDQSSCGDSLHSLEDATYPSHLSSIEGVKKQQDEPRSQSTSHEFEVNLFDPADEDGWKSVKETSESSFEWPGMEVDAKEETVENGSETESKENALASSSNDQRHLISADEDAKVYIEGDSSEVDDEDCDDSVDFECLDDTLDLSMEENIPFVERIALENVNYSINELREDHDQDSESVDSWEQNDDTDDDILDNKKKSLCPMDQSLLSTMSISTYDTMSSSINDDEQNFFNSSHHDEHLDVLRQEFDDNENHDTEEFGPSKINDIQYPDELPACDSSGADRTVFTSDTEETESMTADDDSEGSKGYDPSSGNDDAIIGIARRDEYYPSFDSPNRQDDGNGLSRRIENVQDKIKDLKVLKQENKEKAADTQEARESKSLNKNKETIFPCFTKGDVIAPDSEKLSYPIQEARNSERTTITHEANENKVEPKQNKYVLKSQTSTTPTGSACRLKNIRATERWRRRYR